MPEKTEAQQRRFDALTNILRAGGDIGVGALENAMTIGSGMVAQPVAGLTGLAAGASDLARGRGFARAGESARDTIEDVTDRMTYQPRSDVGQRGAQNIGETMERAAAPVSTYGIEPVAKFSPALAAGLVAATDVVGPKGKPKASALKGAKMAEILRTKEAPGIPVSSETGPILPRSAESRIPAEQALLPRTTPMGRDPVYNERTVALLRSPKAARAVDSLIEKGNAINPDLENWYGSKPLMDFALNEGLSPEEFKRMLAQFSSASQRSPVLKENLMGSHMWGLDRRGEFTPESRLYTNKLAKEGLARGDPGVIELPKGMGSLAQTKIFDRAKQMALGAKPEDVFGEKLRSYYENKLGNEMPVTVDVNAVKGPVISAQNPDWLKTLYTVKDAKGNIVTQSQPLRDFERGKLKMGEAKKTPGLWIDAPDSPGEYKGFEELWRRGADRAGVSPAGAQALGWYGSSDVTALQTKPKTYIELLEESARKAAARQGVTPTEAMSRAVRGVRGGQLGFSRPAMVGALAAGGGAVAAYPLIKKMMASSPPGGDREEAARMVENEQRRQSGLPPLTEQQYRDRQQQQEKQQKR